MSEPPPPQTCAHAFPQHSIRPVGSKFTLKAQQSLTQPGNSFALDVGVPGNKEEAQIGVRENKTGASLGCRCVARLWARTKHPEMHTHAEPASIFAFMDSKNYANCSLFVFFKMRLFGKTGFQSPGISRPGTTPLLAALLASSLEDFVHWHLPGTLTCFPVGYEYVYRDI